MSTFGEPDHSPFLLINTKMKMEEEKKLLSDFFDSVEESSYPNFWKCVKGERTFNVQKNMNLKAYQLIINQNKQK